ncbi:MAG TPA: pentapeptide repeat-containing protein [Archangium sp.]|uniref:pentapeptide repeat-containing protein n=1 Tax=Archangium sp. TaxID=1872627 RepID=UPI002E357506|nr:pentapeptide repeat-containing protein [Archangium sp.]HEX5749836.1 pentapeptide repeat-containing protein [Archangium sp.]
MNVIYEDRELAGERLELTDNKEGNYYLGPNLTLRRCTVVTRVSAGWLHILPTRFIDCTIQVKQELKHHDWSSAFLKGCRFTGRLTDCDFGHRLPHLPGRENGGIEDCDFTEARLQGCRFHSCDMRTLRLPPWPCFTILNPLGRSQELSSLKWPGRSDIIVANPDMDPPSTVAVTYHAPTVAKRYGTTPEELKSVLEKLDYIVY